MQVVFTVSPVRHWKDGALGNQVSKSTLILAVSELQQDIDQAHYFPAYELFMDDLRDYRFYDEDLVHPGSQGIAYTWQKFEDAFFDTDTLALNKKILSLLKAKNHRPRNPETKEYQLFISEHDKKINQIQAAFPLIDFSTLRFQP